MFSYVDLADKNIYKIIDLLNVGIYWKDTDGNFLGCNSYMLSILGLKERKELIGKSDYGFLNKKEADSIAKTDNSVFQGVPYSGEESRELAKGTAKIYLSNKTPLVDEKGKIIGLLGISTDATEFKNKIENEKEQVNLDEAEKFRQIIDVVDASIYWKDADGRYLGCNKYVLNMAGVNSLDEIVGKTDFELFWKNDAPKLRAVDEEVMAKTARYEGEELMSFFATGVTTTRTVLTVKNPLLDNHGNIMGIVGTSLDITSQKEAQAKFIDFIDKMQNYIQNYKIEVLSERLGIKPETTNLNKPVHVTKRESEILYYLSLNKAPKEIARIITVIDNKPVSDSTINATINKKLYPKFGVFSVGALVEKAIQLNAIPFLLTDCS